MKSQKCPNCGAGLKSKSNICEYCGSKLVDDEPIQMKVNPNVDVSPEVVAQTILNNPIVSSSNILVMLIPVVFFFIWTASVFGIAKGAFSSFGSGISNVPLFMGFFGLILFCLMLTAFIAQLYNKLIQDKIFEYAKEKKFDEIFKLCQNKKHFAAYLLIVTFYIKKDYDSAKELALSFSATSSYKIVQSQLFINIFKTFDMTAPTYVIQRRNNG